MNKARLPGQKWPCLLERTACGVPVQIIEQIMEHVAEVSGMDPVEVRRLNFLKAYPVSQAPQIGCSPSKVLEGSSSTTEVGCAVLGSLSHGCPAVRRQSS